MLPQHYCSIFEPSPFYPAQAPEALALPLSQISFKFKS